MIRVLLVDDHALVRMGFRMLLADAKIEVVGEAETGERACIDYARLKPDVVVMDLSMPGMGGLEAVRRLLAQDPKARVLALS
ncbi:MAG TPA: response regulator transcription factor, partial [Burkholderiaceae bacterium]|nr:response regulator transcription factor [Burkholderiaceae bacterium]